MQHWNLAQVDVEPKRPSILATSDEGRAVLLTLCAGEELQEHEVHERTWLLVAAGEVEQKAAAPERAAAAAAAAAARSDARSAAPSANRAGPSLPWLRRCWLTDRRSSACRR